MRFYFAGSISGGRDHAAIYPRIIAALQARGTVLTEHVGDAALDGQGEFDLSDKGIFDRDVAWVDQSDVLVAEVTQPSLGVGYEIGRAEARGIPIVALFDDRSGKRLSAMIAGNAAVTTLRYASEDALLDGLTAALESLT